MSERSEWEVGLCKIVPSVVAGSSSGVGQYGTACEVAVVPVRTQLNQSPAARRRRRRSLMPLTTATTTGVSLNDSKIMRRDKRGGASRDFPPLPQVKHFQRQHVQMRRERERERERGIAARPRDRCHLVSQIRRHFRNSFWQTDGGGGGAADESMGVILYAPLSVSPPLLPFFLPLFPPAPPFFHYVLRRANHSRLRRNGSDAIYLHVGDKGGGRTRE